MAQGLRLFVSTKRGVGLIPRWGTKIPMLCSQKKKKCRDPGWREFEFSWKQEATGRFKNHP